MEVGQGPNWGVAPKEKKIHDRMQTVKLRQFSYNLSQFVVLPSSYLLTLYTLLTYSALKQNTKRK
jgi:hypothetical protein